MAEGHDRSSGVLAFPSALGAEPGAVPREPAACDAAQLDTLSDVLSTVRLTGALFFLTDATSPWVAAAPAGELLAPVLLDDTRQIVSFHVVVRGACWCQVPGLAPARLECGDTLVLPHGDPYALASDPELESEVGDEEALEFFRAIAAGDLPYTVPEGGGGPDGAQVFCGFLGCDARPFNPIVATLPRRLVVRGRAPDGDDGLARLVALAIDESRSRRAGGGCMLLRLSELMFVEVVRRHLASLPTSETGWLAALRDPVVGRALTLLHRSPAAPWTLERLAREAAVSRSVLAERFAALVGRPPMQYLAQWRMQRAARLLADGRRTVAAVAARVGYESDAAFSRAFKKLVGESPARWRKRQAGTAG